MRVGALAWESGASPQLEKTGCHSTGLSIARRVKVPGLYSWGYNDETCPPTSMYAAYGVIPGEKALLLALETGHSTTPEQTKLVNRWLEERLTGRSTAN
jgi:cephalosporin-C deacetylase-like acetyl esterase